jgi:hypothetical protein
MPVSSRPRRKVPGGAGAAGSAAASAGAGWAAALCRRRGAGASGAGSGVGAVGDVRSDVAAAVILDCTEAIRLDPKLVAAYIVRSGAYAEKGEYDWGIADCTEAVRLDPELASAYYIRGLAYLRAYPDNPFW